MDFFNFGTDIKKWVNILLKNFNGVINHCGNISERFSIERGCRQGDPIASYLFIICLEILAIKIRSSSNVNGFKIENLTQLLEIYADDLTIFLHPTSENLRNTINILTDFYRLSGLKINIGKTKAVLFGQNYENNINLCPDLKLQWSQSFTLLGINFTNNLENMHLNYNVKVENIRKLLSAWSYRYLTPFGKVTVVKSLALSKLSHIALVIPNPRKDMISNLTNMIYKFIWGSGSEKVRREDAVLPVKLGGLGVPDIKKFWSAFKFSWFRRLLTSKSFWPNIILTQVGEILGKTVSGTDLLQLGTVKLQNIAKKLENKFWQQVFETPVKMAEGAAFCFPELILTSPFFYNSLVLRNRKVVTEKTFPELVGKVSSMADFFLPNTTQLLDWREFLSRYGNIVSEEKYTDIRYIISLSIQKLGVAEHKLIPAYRPELPLMIGISLAVSKGCSWYSKLLQRRSDLSNKMYKREDKWKNELQLSFSLDFWTNARRLCASINIDNKFKWLQYQVLRNSLQTRVIVSHFRREVSDQCQYCNLEPELISHLFWHCHIVKTFYNDVFNYFRSINVEYAPSMTQMLFGFHKLEYYHPKNYITILLKRYIWCKKCCGCQLNLLGFRGQLKYHVEDLKTIFKLKNEDYKYNDWKPIEHALT